MNEENKASIIKFKDFILDRFQIEAINSIENNHSVVVSAATGTGKTLIADYVIDKYLKQGKKIIYTAPIKALSNQKFSDFRMQYGIESVGIMTGDVTMNPEAPLLIMTTEIYRNMLIANDPFVDDLVYVIFDEIHFLGDPERGTVWEESIIFSRSHTRFICLSATIPNAKQFANWIEHIRKHPVDVIVEKKRAVPLAHLFYDNEHGFATIDQIIEWKELDKYPSFHKSFKNRKQHLDELRNRKRLSHIDLLQTLERESKLPCIYFCFSRSLTEKKAESLKQKRNYLTTEQAVEVSKIVREKLSNTDPSVLTLKTTRLLRECLSHGIGFHHAGILAVLKEMVETLFAKGLIKVLFATETFAVGINMPAKTVCFDSLDKYDGISFRSLNSKEYFQIAGRAGRRGIDKEGFSISVIDRQSADLHRIKEITTVDKESLKSQFRLSYNTILNLMKNHTEKERQIILRSSFFSYQQVGKQGMAKIIASFEKKKNKLYSSGYLIDTKEGPDLTEKGLFAMRIYTQELLVTDLFCSMLTKSFTEEEILLLVGRISFEEKKNTRFDTKKKNISNSIMKKLSDNKDLFVYFKKNQIFLLETFLTEWYEGCEFIDLMKYSNMPEGDIVRFIRQILDLLQQIQHATMDEEFRQKVLRIKDKLDRDVVSVRF
ncbi:MAG: DEAD/DEAH box helicase [Candidatus Woesearchaeota archaeon]|jgi:superfamily II RNA helicase